MECTAIKRNRICLVMFAEIAEIIRNMLTHIVSPEPNWVRKQLPATLIPE